MPYLLWGGFSAISLVHLRACAESRDTLRRVTKGFILPSLMLCYALLCTSFDPFFLLALVLCLAGDLLLIPDKTFPVGGFSFFLAHVMFILSYQKYIDLGGVPAWVWALSAVPVVTLSAVTLAPVLKRKRGLLEAAACGYLASLCAHSAAAAALLYTQRALPAALLWAGTCVFLVSDCMIVHRQFKIRSFPDFNFWIMLTYISAVGLIVFGYIHTAGAVY